MDHSQTQAYLSRIRSVQFAAPDADTLATLQEAHLEAVPFENLSIHWGEPMELGTDHLFTKIVERRRGGFCYECNGLFAELLRSLAYKTTLLSARVAGKDGGYSPEFDHMALLVEIDEPWLVDVGFGDSFRRPLRLVPGLVQAEQGRDFRLVSQGEDLVVERNLLGYGWEPQFRFSLLPRRMSEFQEMFEFHRDSPDSHFRKAPLATLAIPGGRKTLSGLKLIETTTDGARAETEIVPDEYYRVLLEEFGIARQASQ